MKLFKTVLVVLICMLMLGTFTLVSFSLKKDELTENDISESVETEENPSIDDASDDVDQIYQQYNEFREKVRENIYQQGIQEQIDYINS